MYKFGLTTGLIVAGVLLTWSVGCQVEDRQASPGALPTGLGPDAGPRLNASTYFAHGHLLERQGNFEAAVRQYDKALELSPSFLSARNRLGITLNKLGRHAEATAQFRKTLEQNPTEAHLHNNLGFSLYLDGRLAEAEEALERALELQPAYNRARMNYGLVLARQGLYDEARTELTLANGEADGLYNLAVIQTEMGDLAEAARTLESALASNPSFDAARQQLHMVARLAAEAETPAEDETVLVQEIPTTLDAANEPAVEETFVAQEIPPTIDEANETRNEETVVAQAFPPTTAEPIDETPLELVVDLNRPAAQPAIAPPSPTPTTTNDGIIDLTPRIASAQPVTPAPPTPEPTLVRLKPIPIGPSNGPFALPNSTCPFPILSTCFHKMIAAQAAGSEGEYAHWKEEIQQRLELMKSAP